VTIDSLVSVVELAIDVLLLKEAMWDWERSVLWWKVFKKIALILCGGSFHDPVELGWLQRPSGSRTHYKAY
jgi:hypothetical protein